MARAKTEEQHAQDAKTTKALAKLQATPLSEAFAPAPPDEKYATKPLPDQEIVLNMEAKIDVDAAQEIMREQEPGDPNPADVTSVEAIGKYMLGRNLYDLASIVGGTITHVVELVVEVGKPQKYALVVEVNRPQSPPEHFVVVPVNNFSNDPTTGSFDIQKLEG